MAAPRPADAASYDLHEEVVLDSKIRLNMTEQKPQRDEDFYSRRVFVIGVIVCVLLALGSLYLLLALRDRSRLEDCFMQGRTNCLPLDPTPAGK